jgi:DNA-binding NtrC family response regulator
MEAPTGEAGLKDIIRMKSAELEKDLITKALEETGGNVTRAAKLLQISRKSLQTKMKEFGLRDTAPEGKDEGAGRDDGPDE